MSNHKWQRNCSKTRLKRSCLIFSNLSTRRHCNLLSTSSPLRKIFPISNIGTSKGLRTPGEISRVRN